MQFSNIFQGHYPRKDTHYTNLADILLPGHNKQVRRDTQKNVVFFFFDKMMIRTKCPFVSVHFIIYHRTITTTVPFSSNLCPFWMTVRVGGGLWKILRISQLSENTEFCGAGDVFQLLLIFSQCGAL